MLSQAIWIEMHLRPDPAQPEPVSFFPTQIRYRPINCEYRPQPPQKANIFFLS